MTKKPEYVDKISFNGRISLRFAMNDYLSDNKYLKVMNSAYRKYNAFSNIPLKDVYKFDLRLFPEYRKVMKKLGERINDVLIYMGIDYEKATVYSDRIYYMELLQKGYTCIYCIKCQTKDNKQIYVYFSGDMLIMHDIENDDLICYEYKKYDSNNDYKINKITQLDSEKLSSNISYKSFKNRDENIYKVYNNDSKLEIGVGKREVVDEENLTKIIKSVSLNQYNIEYIFKRIGKSISLQKDDKTYLTIKRYDKNMLVDKLTIRNGEIAILKPINDNKKYRSNSDIYGNLYRWHYNENNQTINYCQSKKKEQKIESLGFENEIESMKMCKKVSDDINNQHQKILSYMKK